MDRQKFFSLSRDITFAQIEAGVVEALKKLDAIASTPGYSSSLVAALDEIMGGLRESLGTEIRHDWFYTLKTQQWETKGIVGAINADDAIELIAKRHGVELVRNADWGAASHCGAILEMECPTWW